MSPASYPVRDKPPPEQGDVHVPPIFYHHQKKFKMVTVTGVEQRKNAKEEMFPVLIISGDLEIRTSKATGKPYAAVSKMSIPCAFDEHLAQKMIGKQLKGEIQRVECDPYDYTNPDTAEVISLNHTYQYCPDPTNLAEVIMGQPA